MKNSNLTDGGRSNRPLSDLSVLPMGEPMSAATNERFQLWIDAVGGYLVCRGDVVTIGQAIPGAQVDIPIVADISRRHATIRRDGEGYLLVPRTDVTVDGRTVQGAEYLRDGSLIELAGGVQLRFHKSHPLSATARLDFVSRHRTQPPCDAVLLMADTCILGPKSSAHVVCRDWPAEVILFGGKRGLQVRSQSSFEVDGKKRVSPAHLPSRGHVSGEEFSFSLEPFDS